MSFFEKIKKSVSGVSVDSASQIENEKVAAVVSAIEPEKAPLEIVEAMAGDIKPVEPERIALRAVSGEMVEAECMRIIPILCQKAEESPKLRPEVSKLIDIFFELERAGNDSELLEALRKAESRYRA
ncbi:MAG TPA: hypothetical protein PLM07_06685 [Candidatus Rifleibacterium sp.]|mgnify:CR=1 FL=1|nr:hypothetical protein [Candidatus Rifleibacterium sp.]HPT45567.1 hypothetical protein [Candidatus Rifleibacterium sp.]